MQNITERLYCVPLNEMVIYMEVTQDEYELPVVIADDLAELSWRSRTTKNAIKSAISHLKSGKIKKSRFIKVEIPEGEENAE